MSQDERLVVLLEARVSEFEKRMRKAEQTGSDSYRRMRTGSRSATKQMEKDMVGATQKINQALSSTSGQIGSFAKSFAKGFVGGAVAAAFAGVTASATATIRSIAELGDEAKRAGMNAESFQEWKFVAEQNRIGIDALTDGFKELSLRADEFVVTGSGSAAEAFARIGYTASDLKKKLKDPSALMLEIIGRLEKVDKAAQIRIADELFGGTGGERFVELLDKGEAGIRDQIKTARDLGVVIDNDMIAKAAKLDAKFNEVAAQMRTLWQNGVVGAAEFFGLIEDEQLRLSIKPTDFFENPGQGKSVLGKDATQAFEEGKEAAADYAEEIANLQKVYGNLMGEAERLAPYLQRAAGDAARMGESGASDELNRIAYEMRAAAEQLRNGEINAKQFEEKLASSTSEAGTLLGELAKVDAAPFSGVISALGKLGETIRSRISEAAQLRAALPGGAAMTTGTPLSGDAEELLPPSPYAPTSSIRPQQ